MLKTSAVSLPQLRGRRVYGRGLSAAGEKFIHRSRPGHFRVGMSHTGDRVRVAAGNRDFSQLAPLAVPHSHWPRATSARSVFQMPVHRIQTNGNLPLRAARQPGENVIGTEEKFPLGEVHQSGTNPSASLNLHMVAFCDAIDAHVHLGAAGHPDSNLLAQEEVRVAPQGLRPSIESWSVMVTRDMLIRFNRS